MLVTQAIASAGVKFGVNSQDPLSALAIANVDKVTLEFGSKIGGETGIPYVTKGTAESNLKITVECSFPNQIEEQDR